MGWRHRGSSPAPALVPVSSTQRLTLRRCIRDVHMPPPPPRRSGSGRAWEVASPRRLGPRATSGVWGETVPRPEPKSFSWAPGSRTGTLTSPGACDTQPAGRGEPGTPFLPVNVVHDFPRRGNGRKTDSLTFPSRIPHLKPPRLCGQERLFGLAGPPSFSELPWVTNGAAWGQSLTETRRRGLPQGDGAWLTDTVWVQPQSPGSVPSPLTVSVTSSAGRLWPKGTGRS